MAENSHNYMYQIINVCIQNYIPFVVYRLPYSQESIIAIQSQKLPLKIEAISELNQKSGFLITPFEINGLHHTFLLEPDFIMPLSEVEDEHITYFSQINTFEKSYYSNGKDLFETNQNLFVQQVKEIQNYIKNGTIKKAVLSRIHVENRNKILKIADIYNTISNLYPDAFVYLLQMPYVGCWIGATPEPFIRTNKKHVEIESIAGTYWLGENDENNVVWGEKEKEEQWLVSSFIEEKLRQLGVNDFEKHGPTTLKAGNLAHIKTLYRFQLQRIQNNTDKFIQELHPTPSVCGLPQKEAMQIIKTVELHNREYYSGLIGLLNLQGTTQLYTNIRCMKINPDNFEIFLGAGITASSIPEAEWEETNYKKTTMLSAIEYTLNKNKL